MTNRSAVESTDVAGRMTCCEIACAISFSSIAPSTASGQGFRQLLRTSKERSTANFAQIAARAVAAPRIALTRA